MREEEKETIRWAMQHYRDGFPDYATDESHAYAHKKIDAALAALGSSKEESVKICKIGKNLLHIYREFRHWRWWTMYRHPEPPLIQVWLNPHHVWKLEVGPFIWMRIRKSCRCRPSKIPGECIITGECAKYYTTGNPLYEVKKAEATEDGEEGPQA